MNEQLLRDFRPLLVSKMTEGSPDKSSWALSYVSPPAAAFGEGAEQWHFRVLHVAGGAGSMKYGWSKCADVF